MPSYIITAPNGKKYRVTGPEGSTKEQALAHFKEQYARTPQPAAGTPAAPTPSGTAPAAPGAPRVPSPGGGGDPPIPAPPRPGTAVGTVGDPDNPRGGVMDLVGGLPNYLSGEVPKAETYEEKQRRALRKYGASDPTLDAGRNFVAGYGQSGMDMYRGGRQMYNYLADPEKYAQLQKEEEEARRLDEPLLNTTSGRLGQIAGFATTSALPAGGAAKAANIANKALKLRYTLPGMMASEGTVGAGVGAFQPTVEGESRGVNTAVGAGIGIVAPGVVPYVAKPVLGVVGGTIGGTGKLIYNAARIGLKPAFARMGERAVEKEAARTAATREVGRRAAQNVVKDVTIPNKQLAGALTNYYEDFAPILTHGNAFAPERAWRMVDAPPPVPTTPAQRAARRGGTRAGQRVTKAQKAAQAIAANQEAKQAALRRQTGVNDDELAAINQQINAAGPPAGPPLDMVREPLNRPIPGQRTGDLAPDSQVINQQENMGMLERDEAARAQLPAKGPGKPAGPAVQSRVDEHGVTIYETPAPNRAPRSDLTETGERPQAVSPIAPKPTMGRAGTESPGRPVRRRFGHGEYESKPPEMGTEQWRRVQALRKSGTARADAALAKETSKTEAKAAADRAARAEARKAAKQAAKDEADLAAPPPAEEPGVVETPEAEALVAESHAPPVEDDFDINRLTKDEQSEYKRLEMAAMYGDMYGSSYVGRDHAGVARYEALIAKAGGKVEPAPTATSVPGGIASRHGHVASNPTTREAIKRAGKGAPTASMGTARAGALRGPKGQGGSFSMEPVIDIVNRLRGKAPELPPAPRTPEEVRVKPTQALHSRDISGQEAEDVIHLIDMQLKKKDLEDIHRYGLTRLRTLLDDELHGHLTKAQKKELANMRRQALTGKNMLPAVIRPSIRRHIGTRAVQAYTPRDTINRAVQAYTSDD